MGTLLNIQGQNIVVKIVSVFNILSQIKEDDCLYIVKKTAFSIGQENKERNRFEKIC